MDSEELAARFVILRKTTERAIKAMSQLSFALLDPEYEAERAAALWLDQIPPSYEGFQFTRT